MGRSGTLAIDLGSTTTVVAFQAEAGGPLELVEVPPFSCGNPSVVPSLLWLEVAETSQPLIGRQVLESGLATRQTPQLCRDFKRRIGASAEGPQAVITPEQAGTLLLHQLWSHLPAELSPQRLVLTAPIDGYRGYREWLRRASQGLAVEEVALVDEPTAAAIGAGLPPGSRVLVVDFGGGTIDLSLVILEGGEGRAAPIAQLLRFAGRDLENSRQALRCARVVGKAGLAIGGRDIDHWIASELCPDLGGDALLEAAEKLKCCLSDQDEAVVLWSPPEQASRELTLSRTALDALLERRGLVALLDELLERVLAAARAQGLAIRDLDAVLPVGGSSRLPLIRRWLRERFPGIPLRDERPVEAVALGALSLTPGVRVRDVLSRGVSLRCWDQRGGRHHWHPLFLAGQSWPTVQPLELVLACSREGQRQLELALGEPVEEERSEVIFRGGLPELRRRPAGEARVEPWSVQPLPLPLSPPGERGVDRLRLRFGIDEQAHLTLVCEDLLTGAIHAPAVLGPVR